MRTRKMLAALALLPVLLAPLHSQAGPRYTITALPDGFQPADINNSGQIAGSLLTASGATHAALFSNGLLTDLGGFGGSFSSARAINESGLVTGIAETADSGLHAFLYRDGVLTDIGAGYDGSTNAVSLNNHGQVVGQIGTPNGYRGFIYSDGAFTILPPLGTGDIAGAWDINDSGTAVGESSLNPELHAPFHPFSYRDGVLTDLGNLADRENSSARVINNAGRIAGYSEAEDGSLHAFIYENGVMTDVGSFGGLFMDVGDINESGSFVGDASANPGPPVGFIYRDNALVDLNTLIDPRSGWYIEAAYGINDLGQVVGRACRDFACSGVCLDLVSEVPEPATAAMLASGVLLMARVRRRRPRRGADTPGAQTPHATQPPVA